MIKNITLSLLPMEAADESAVAQAVAAEAGVGAKRVTGYIIDKRSIDARGRQVKMILQVRVYIDEKVDEGSPFEPGWQDVSGARHVVIVGAGPAGLFAALRMITLGIKPIVIERGKDVRSRRRDLAAM